MQFVEVGAHRTRPPFFDYRYVINTVRQITAWMMSQGPFREIGMALVVDRINLGTGLFLLKKELQQLRWLDGVPMFNQSVAASRRYKTRQSLPVPPTQKDISRAS